MSLRCWVGLHEHGVYTADLGYEPAFYVERCSRCDRMLSTEPRARSFYFHESLVERARCHDAIVLEDESSLVCPGHVLDEDGRQVATMRPLTLERLARERAPGSRTPLRQ